MEAFCTVTVTVPASMDALRVDCVLDTDLPAPRSVKVVEPYVPAIVPDAGVVPVLVTVVTRVTLPATQSLALARGDDGKFSFEVEGE